MRDFIHGAVPSALFVALICLPAVAGERPSPEQLQAWVKQLDAEDYAAREEATRQLTAAGEVSIEALAAGVGSTSPEVAWRASESLQEIAIQGDEATLSRVVAALDKLSTSGRPGLSNVAQELRAKQIKLRHDRAAGQIRALGGKLAGGGEIAMGFDGGFGGAFIGGIDVMPAAIEAVPAELVEEIRAVDVFRDLEAEAPPDKPGPLKALDAALKRLADLLPVADEPEPPPIEDVALPAVPAAPEAVPAPDEPAPVPPDVPPAGEFPAPPAPAVDAVPADAVPADAAPEAPAAEAPLAEPAEGEVVPAEVDVAIADAIVVDAGFIAGPIFGGGFFIEEGTFPETSEGLSTALALDSTWRGGDDGLKALRDLPTLTSLSIADAKLTDAALPHIAALPNLQHLSIVNTRFSVAALEKFRKARPATKIFARGAAMLGIHADTSGSCILTGVYNGSGAAEAGLLVGDKITTIDGHKINDFGDLTIAVYAHAPGEKLKVEFLRGDETKTAVVELKPRADLEAPRQ